jgi:hypothetical protein
VTEDTQTCPQCGSVVGDEIKHLEWHARIDGIDGVADEALETAQGAANTLYQNNISL